MGVSTRYKTTAFLAASTLLLSTAAASPLEMGAPGIDKGAGCCDAPKQHEMTIPGFHVAPPSITVTVPGVRTNPGQIIAPAPRVLDSGIVVAPQPDVVLGGGGGGVFGAPGVSRSSIPALNVTGGGETVTRTITDRVAVEEEVCIDQPTLVSTIKPVRAVCIDDTGTPHPASRVDSHDQVAAQYSGEVYRCMAGTSMQVTIGKLDSDQPSFSQAQSFSCAKGEALIHKPGGNLSCARQTPERNCNERSLLRRHGPGTKLIETRHKAACVPTKRTVMKPVTRQVETAMPAAPAPITFDGGVGQGVY